MKNFQSDLPDRSQKDDDFDGLIADILKEKIKQQRLNLLGDQIMLNREINKVSNLEEISRK